MAYSLAQNKETADHVTQKIFVQGEDISKFISRWAAETGASVPKLAENLNWFLGKIKAGEGQNVSNLFSLYFTGAGAGRVGLTTLNSILTEMKDANLSSIDAPTLRSFMEYNGGDAAQGRRYSETALQNFQICHALKIAEGEMVPSRRSGASGQGGSQVERAQGSAGARPSSSGVQARAGAQAEGEDEGAGAGVQAAAPTLPQFDSSALDQIQNEMYSAQKKMNSEWSAAMSSKWNIIKEGIIAPAKSKERYALEGKFAIVNSQFNLLTAGYSALQITIRSGNATAFGAAFNQYSIALERYVTSLRDLQQMTSNYDARSGTKLVGASIDLALEAAMLVPLAGGLLRLAGTGTGAAMRGLSGMGKADWIASGVSTLVFGSALTGKEIAETRAVNNALANFETDQTGTIHKLRLMLLEWKKQLAAAPNSSSLVQQIDVTMSKLADIEYALKRREKVDAKDVALIFAQVAILSIGFSAMRPAKLPAQQPTETAPAKKPAIANRQIVPTDADFAPSPSPASAPAQAAGPTKLQGIRAKISSKKDALREKWQNRTWLRPKQKAPSDSEAAPPDAALAPEPAAAAKQSALWHPIKRARAALEERRAAKADAAAQEGGAPAEKPSWLQRWKQKHEAAKAAKAEAEPTPKAASTGTAEAEGKGKFARAVDLGKEGVAKGKEVVGKVKKALSPEPIEEVLVKNETGYSFLKSGVEIIKKPKKEGGASITKTATMEGTYELEAGDQVKTAKGLYTLKEDGAFKVEGRLINAKDETVVKKIRGGLLQLEVGKVRQIGEKFEFENTANRSIRIMSTDGTKTSLPPGETYPLAEGDIIYTGRNIGPFKLIPARIRSYVFEKGEFKPMLFGKIPSV